MAGGGQENKQLSQRARGRVSGLGVEGALLAASYQAGLLPGQQRALPEALGAGFIRPPPPKALWDAGALAPLASVFLTTQGREGSDWVPA